MQTPHPMSMTPRTMWTPPPDRRKSYQKNKNPSASGGVFLCLPPIVLFGFNLLRLCDALIALAA